MERRDLLDEPRVKLKGARSYEITLSDSGLGSIARIDNALERLERDRDDRKREHEEALRRLDAMKARLAQPFEQETELRDALSELAKVNTELDIDREPDDGTLLDEDEQRGREDEDAPVYDDCGELDDEDELAM
jgi:hypothetical protein